jgi:hypothetical protein
MPAVTGDPESSVRGTGDALRGLEPRTHGHGQDGQRAEGVHDLAKHVNPFLSDWLLGSAC